MKMNDSRLCQNIIQHLLIVKKTTRLRLLGIIQLKTIYFGMTMKVRGLFDFHENEALWFLLLI